MAEFFIGEGHFAVRGAVKFKQTPQNASVTLLMTMNNSVKRCRSMLVEHQLHEHVLLPVTRLNFSRNGANYFSILLRKVHATGLLF